MLSFRQRYKYPQRGIKNKEYRRIKDWEVKKFIGIKGLQRVSKWGLDQGINKECQGLRIREVGGLEVKRIDKVKDQLIKSK